MRLGRGKSFQDRRCDYAERSLGTDEKLLQVIAGCCPCADRASRPTPLPRAARPRVPARAREHCHSAAPRCRPRWWKDCRRFRSFPRRRGSMETAAGLFSAILHVANTHPASTVMVLFRVSTARTRFMRERLRTICVPLASGVAAPQRPVFRPVGRSPCAIRRRRAPPRPPRRWRPA